MLKNFVKKNYKANLGMYFKTSFQTRLIFKALSEITNTPMKKETQQSKRM